MQPFDVWLTNALCRRNPLALANVERVAFTDAVPVLVGLRLSKCDRDTFSDWLPGAHNAVASQSKGHGKPLSECIPGRDAIADGHGAAARGIEVGGTVALALAHAGPVRAVFCRPRGHVVD